MLNLFQYELKSRWKGILGWGIGMILFGSMYIFIYPEMSDQMAGLADLSIYQAMNIDMATLAGFIASVVVQYVPLILGVYAIIASTGTLAGEEDSGTLELILSKPLQRWQILSMKALAISLAILLIIIIIGIGDVLSLIAIRSSVEVDVTSIQLFVAILNGFPLLFAFMMIGMFLGAYLPSRRIAVTVLAAIFIASYMLNILFGLVDVLKPLRPLSLFYFFDTSSTVFTEGVALGDVIVLMGVGLVFFVLALMSFEKRDVTVGKWPWQRPPKVAA